MNLKFWEKWIIVQPERVLLRKHLSELMPSNFESVLDVGGGDGNRYRNMFKGVRYICLDYDSELKPDVVASADNMPFENGEFELVFSSQMLEHVLHPRDCLLEMNRVLQDGKFLIITIPQTNELHSEPYDYWRFTCFGMKQLLMESNFELVQMIQRGSIFTVINQILVRFLIDRYNVYEKKINLLFVYPITKVLNLFFNLLEVSFGSSVAARKHTLGWTILAKKKIYKAP